jgi:hypothetical protein
LLDEKLTISGENGQESALNTSKNNDDAPDFEYDEDDMNELVADGKYLIFISIA